MNTKIAIIIGIAIVIAAVILGGLFYQARKPVNTVRVVGYASGDYDSDILKWKITISATSPQNDMMRGFISLNNDITRFRAFLTEKDFDASELEIMPSWNYANYNRDGAITGHIFEQNVAFTLRDQARFEEIENLAFDLTEIAKTGMNIKNSAVEYYISELPELKKEIIAEATKDARQRAQQVATTTNAKLGKLLNGRVGVFQITEPLSVEVQSYGIYNTHTKKKQVSVTLSGEFELK